MTAGRPPYETTCPVCAPGIRPGAVVEVAAARRNRRRVTIDVGQGGRRDQARSAHSELAGRAFQPRRG